MNDTESRQENNRTLEIFVQPRRIIDVGWMDASEYDGPAHQAYLAKEGHGDPEDLPVFIRFPNATTSMHVGHYGKTGLAWYPVDIVVKLDGRTIFDCCASPVEGNGVRFVEKTPPFLTPSNTDASRWIVGATILKYTVWSSWKMQVPADFSFDPAKLEIPFFRIPIESGDEPAVIARHSDVRYDGRGPALDRGDFEDVDGDEVYRFHTSFTLADLKTLPPLSPLNETGCIHSSVGKHEK